MASLSLYWFVLLVLCHSGLGGIEKCTEIRYIGGEPVKQDNTHDAVLRVFLDPSYIISADGNIIGWQFMNMRTGKFYLDIWEKVTDYQKYKLISKTECFNAPIGLNIMKLSTPIAVKKGQHLGIHTPTGYKGGVSTGNGDPNLKYPNFGEDKYSDEMLVSNGNVYEGNLDNYRKHGRKYSFRALLFIQNTDVPCYRSFAKNSALDISKVALLSTQTTDDVLSCGRICSRNENCMTFKFQTSTKECSMYPSVFDTLPSPGPDDIYGT